MTRPTDDRVRFIGELMERRAIYGDLEKTTLTDNDVKYLLDVVFSITGADLMPNAVESFRRYAGKNPTDRDVLNLATSAKGQKLLSQLVQGEAVKVAKSLSSSSGPQLTPKHKKDRCIFCKRPGPGHDYTYCVAKPIDKEVDVEWATGAVSIKTTKASITYKYLSSKRRHICHGCAQKTMLLSKWQLPAFFSMFSFAFFALLLIVSLIAHGGFIMGLFLFGLLGVTITTIFIIRLWTWCKKVPDEIPSKFRPDVDQLDLIEARLILEENNSAGPLSLLFWPSPVWPSLFRSAGYFPSKTGEHCFTWMNFVDSTTQVQKRLVAALAEDLRKSKAQLLPQEFDANE